MKVPTSAMVAWSPKIFEMVCTRVLLPLGRVPGPNAKGLLGGLAAEAVAEIPLGEADELGVAGGDAIEDLGPERVRRAFGRRAAGGPLGDVVGRVRRPTEACA